MENIKRSLGVITKLDWIQAPHVIVDNKSIILVRNAPETITIHTTDQITSTTHSELEELHKQTSKITTIHIPANTWLRQPLYIQGTISAHHHIIMQVEDKVKGSIFFDITSKNGEETITTGLDMSIGEQCTLDIGSKLTHDTNQLHHAQQKIIIGKNSKIGWFNVLTGSKQLIFSGRAELEEATSLNHITSAFANKGEQFDINTESIHKGAHSHSNMQVKSIVQSGTVLTRGLVQINKEAKHASGYEHSTLLLVDKEARAASIPDLKIHNNDVTCSHGSTITNVNDDHLFYFLSRGIDQSQAKEMIIQGFKDDVYDQFPESIRGLL